MYGIDSLVLELLMSKWSEVRYYTNMQLKIQYLKIPTQLGVPGWWTIP